MLQETNGKGSTCSFITSILKEAGYKVGLYTSPYLETFTEKNKSKWRKYTRRRCSKNK